MISEGFEVLCPLSMTLRDCSINHLKTLKFAFIEQFQGKTPRKTKHNRKMKSHHVTEKRCQISMKNKVDSQAVEN